MGLIQYSFFNINYIVFNPKYKYKELTYIFDQLININILRIKFFNQKKEIAQIFLYLVNFLFFNIKEKCCHSNSWEN